MCFRIKLDRLQKNISKDYAFLPRVFSSLLKLYVLCESVQTLEFVTGAAVSALLVLSAALGQTFAETTEVFSWLDCSAAAVV